MRTFVCFGDSNTHGTLPMHSMEDRRRLGPEKRWPGVAKRLLGDGWNLVEEGLPGRTTVHDDPIEGAHKNGRLALPMVLETHRPIDFLVIKLGTNDLKQRFSVTAWDIAASAGKLVEMAMASDCGRDFGPPQVLLVAPAPVLETGCLAEMFTGGAAKSQAFGVRYRETAGDLGCRFLDAGMVMASSLVDGIHFDELAHGALGEAIAVELADMAGTNLAAE